jgi:hypothetical protein
LDKTYQDLNRRQTEVVGDFAQLLRQAVGAFKSHFIT